MAFPTHHAARAKRVIFLCMNGGPSHVDTFDPKPALRTHEGKMPAGKQERDAKAGYMSSPFSLHAHGESGVVMSELFPHLARCADDLCVIRSMHTDVPNHEPGLLLMHVEYGPTHPFTTSLPDVYAPPGSTPAPVVLSGGWNATTNQAEFSWPSSSNPNVAEYELRMSPGATYDAGTATVIGNSVTGTNFNTAAGLANSGDVASFKVFVIVTTGNEADSNTITITRP